MRSAKVKTHARNILFIIPGLFICFMIFPSSALADPYWSIGISGGSAGINGFTFSFSDFCGIPVHYAPPCGQAYGYYDSYPKYQNNFQREGCKHQMNRPDGPPRNDSKHDKYKQNLNRTNSHNQNFSRPDGFKRNTPGMKQYSQNMPRPDQGNRCFSRPDREKQRQWEARMMNTVVTLPR